MGTKPPRGPHPISRTRAGAAGSQACTNGQFAASQRSSEVTLIDPTPPARAAADQRKPLLSPPRHDAYKTPLSHPANKRSISPTRRGRQMGRSRWWAHADHPAMSLLAGQRLMLAVLTGGKAGTGASAVNR